jgi:hypothetical protein
MPRGGGGQVARRRSVPAKGDVEDNTMLYRAVSVCLVGLALAVFVQAQQAAQATKANTHDGTVVSASATKLVMKAKDTGKEMTHTLAPGAKITCDGKACKLIDLRAGQQVRVTTEATNPTVATRIEALDKQRTFSTGAGR